MNATESINSRFDQTEEKERICDVEDSSFEIIWLSENKEKRMKKNKENLCELWDTMKWKYFIL